MTPCPSFTPNDEGNMLFTKEYPVILLPLCYIIPVGFETDGASVPGLLQLVVGKPYEEDLRDGAFVHDGLYQSKGKVIIDGHLNKTNRPYADFTFYSILLEHAPEWKAVVCFLGVRLFGWWPWYVSPIIDKITGRKRKIPAIIHINTIIN